MSQFTYAAYNEGTSLSAGITSTDTSMEVDAIPVGVSAGDRVKCALQGSPGELVYGVVGTIGGGSNSGTDIDMSASEDGRGKEGTSAAAFSSGDTVVVGVGARAEVAARTPALVTDPSLRTKSDDSYIQPTHKSNDSRSTFGARIYFCQLLIPVRSKIITARIEITTAATGTGELRIGVAQSDDEGYPSDVLFSQGIDPTTTGQKEITSSVIVSPGQYHGFLWDNDNWDSQPEWRATDSTFGFASGKVFNVAWFRTLDEFTSLPASFSGENVVTDRIPGIQIKTELA